MKKIRSKKVILISIFIVLFVTLIIYLSGGTYTPRIRENQEMIDAIVHLNSGLTSYIVESDDFDLRLNSSSTVTVRELLDGLYYGIQYEGKKYGPYVDMKDDRFVKMFEDKKLKIVMEKIEKDLYIDINVSDKDEIIIKK